ncbi:peptidase M20, partial [Candidatus Saccharibacteria bacterium]|nr:peptidase M20 [Candidatus Saccharibacteria bacterium]
MKQDLEALFLQLVQRRSVVSSAGEIEIIDFIEEYLRSWDYFLEHPGDLVRVPTENDP